jgi:L-lactate permease
MTKQQTEIIDFVKQTTIAITTISESTKSLQETTGAIKEMISAQNVVNAQSTEKLSGKMDGLITMFKYVIIPLVAGILALVGVKLVFNL